MTSTKKLKTFFVLGLMSVLSVGCTFSNPLRRSEESIKSRILKDSPYGTPFEEVIRIVELKKYDDVSINRETGFIHQGVRPMKLVGVKSIRASLGDYQGIPFQANVTAFWGFDSESKLIEIWVWKTSDGL